MFWCIFLSGNDEGWVAVRGPGIWLIPEFARGNVPSMKQLSMTYVLVETKEICSFSLFLALRLGYDYNLLISERYLFYSKGFSKAGIAPAPWNSDGVEGGGFPNAPWVKTWGGFRPPIPDHTPWGYCCYGYGRLVFESVHIPQVCLMIEMTENHSSKMSVTELLEVSWRWILVKSHAVWIFFNSSWF